MNTHITNIILYNNSFVIHNKVFCQNLGITFVLILKDL